MVKKLSLNIVLLILLIFSSGKADAQYDKQQFFYRGQHLLFEGHSTVLIILTGNTSGSHTESIFSEENTTWETLWVRVRILTVL